MRVQVLVKSKQCKELWLGILLNLEPVYLSMTITARLILENKLMYLEQFAAISDLLMELITGKSSRTAEPKTNLKSEWLLAKISIWIVLFAITHLASHIMVFFWLNLGLGQLRNGSNATGSSYGKRFKKSGVLGICLNMDKGTLSFALDGEYMGVAFTN